MKLPMLSEHTDGGASDGDGFPRGVHVPDGERKLGVAWKVVVVNR